MKRAALLLTLLITAGCTLLPAKEHGWKPPRPHPTQEQIWALTDPNFKPEPERVKLQLSIVPQQPFVYNDVRVTCIMPNIDGWYQFSSSNGSLGQSGQINGQRIHVTNIGCEPVEFYCAYKEYIPQKGYGKLEQVRLVVTPAGECR